MDEIKQCDKKRVLGITCLLILLFLSGCNTDSQTFELDDFYIESQTYEDIDSKIVWPLEKGSGFDEKTINELTDLYKSLSFTRSLIIMKDNQLMMEAYFNGSGPSDSENVHSVSKSILSALIGIAIEEGFIEDIDQSIADFLPSDYFEGEYKNRNKITIRHLLNMNTGLDWSEDYSEYRILGELDWVKDILEQDMLYIPGTHFNYSTGNTYLLAVVLAEATGIPLKDYAEQYLLNDIGVTVEYWHKNTQGYYSGGCNLFLTPMEIARFGQLYLDKGVWNDKQVIPEAWVKESVEKSVFFDDTFYDGGYGYLWWTHTIKGYEVKTAWGYGGQMLHIIPELDLIFVSTTNSGMEAAHENSMLTFELLEDVIISSFE